MCMPTPVNQKEYLKKYLNADSKSKKEKKKKRKKDCGSGANKRKGMSLIEDVIDISNIPFGFAEEDDAPTIAEITYEDEKIKQLENFKSQSGKWKNIGHSDPSDDYGISQSSSVHLDKGREPSDRNSLSLSQNEMDVGDRDSSSPKGRREKGSRYDSDTSPPRIRRNDSHAFVNGSKKQNNSVLSPSRKKKHELGSSPPRKRLDPDSSPIGRRKHDSETLPPRRKRHDSDSSPVRRNRHDSDASPQRRKRHDSDASPQRRKRHDSDASPPRKRSGSDVSPPRHKRDDSDASALQRKKRHDSDASPRRKGHDSDASPPRRKKHDSDPSPPRRKRDDSDPSPKRKGSDFVSSPPRRKRHDSDSSPPRRKRHDSDSSPPRRPSSNPTNKPVEQRRPEKKMTTREYLRARKMGKLKQETPEDLLRQEREAELQKKAEEKYKDWNKGVTQKRREKEKIEDTIHEMGKSFARSADDEDMNKKLKDVMRQEDPMLEYILKKKAKDDSRVQQHPVYKGSFPPNRLQIRPGYRWDGVDRSSGFEKAWFDRQNDKRAVENDSYKWSTEDM